MDSYSQVIPFSDTNISNLSQATAHRPTVSLTTNHESLPGKIAIVVTTSCITSIIAIPCNLYNMIIIYKSPSLRDMNNLLICNLAFIDFLSSIIVLPLVIIISLFWITKGFICQFQAFMLHLTYAASLTATSIISIDRCIAITTPFRYNPTINRRKCIIIGIYIWMMPLLISVLPVLGLKELGLGAYDFQVFCGLIYEDYQHTYLIQIIVLGFISITIAGIIICYAIIFIIAYFKSSQVISQNITLKRSIRTTTAIVGTNLICWIPLLIFALIEYSQRHQVKDLEDPSYFNMVSLSCIFSNSAINPIIYAVTNAQLRKRYRLLFFNK